MACLLCRGQVGLECLVLLFPNDLVSKNQSPEPFAGKAVHHLLSGADWPRGALKEIHASRFSASSNITNENLWQDCRLCALRNDVVKAGGVVSHHDRHALPEGVKLELA